MQNEGFTLQGETEPLKHGHQKLDVKEGSRGKWAIEEDDRASLSR